MHVVRLAAPSRIGEIVEFQDLRWIGLRRIAHPDPDQVLALDDRIAPHAEVLRDVVLSRDLDALAARLELEPVVHAADVVAFAPAVGELGAAMAAAIVERDDAAAVAAIEHDRLLEDGAGEEFAVDQLVIPRRDVPAVLQKGLSLGAHQNPPAAILAELRPAV